MRGQPGAWLLGLVTLVCGCSQILGLEDPTLEDPTLEEEPNSGPVDDGTSAATCEGVTLGGRCYERFDDAVPWVVAQIKCTQRGASLAKIESQTIKDAVADLIGLGDEVYLGASDRNSPGTFRWLDLSPVTFNGWLVSQPDDDPGEDCMALHHVGAIGFADLDCDALHAYVCERSL